MAGVRRCPKVGTSMTTSCIPGISPAADESLCHNRLRITAFYEDLPTGVRAKHFIDALRLVADEPLDEHPQFWRLALADSQETSAEMLENAKSSEFVMLSLRGDQGLTRGARNLLQEWALSAMGQNRNIILLFNPLHADPNLAVRVRRYVRVLTDQYGIAFFGHLGTLSAGTVPDSLGRKGIDWSLPQRDAI